MELADLVIANDSPRDVGDVKIKIKNTMKKNVINKLTVAGIACMMSASVSFATPTYDSFGQLPGLIAGGTPGKNVAISTTGAGLTLGLSAQQRYSANPAVTDNGLGTFYSLTGNNVQNSHLGSTWNFDFYVGGANVGQYTYSISYGLAGGTVYAFNPLADVDAQAFFTSTGAYQDSQNLLFPDFGGAANGFAGLFDPNADATYDFLLTAKDSSGAIVKSAGITVVVGNGSSVPDSGSTLALMGMAFAGIAGLRRKFLV